MYQIEQDQYVNFIKGFLDKPFNLTNAWVEYQKEKGNNVVFFADDLIQPQIVCWGRVKKVRFIGEVLDVQGPLYKQSASYKKIYKFLESLKQLEYVGVFINLNTKYDVLFEESIRKASYKRPIGQSSTNLTVLINTKDLKPTRNWKRNIKKAENINFSCSVKNSVSLEECNIIELLQKENSLSKELNYTLEANTIYKLTNQENILTFFLYRDSKPIAARIISIEHTISHDVYACNSFQSREDGATQFLMEFIFIYLKDNDITYFDFSRIPLGKNGAKGVYEFKHAAGGTVIQYNGEWVFFKNERLRHLYYLYNLFINKKDFY